MPISMVCGLQWGDEAKGKATHLLSEGMDYVARFAGGPNSGHTIVSNNVRTALHVIPAGIMKEGVTNLMGSGMVLDPVGLVAELEGVSKQIDYTGRLFVSEGAHLIFEYHRYQEKLDEKARGKGKIGTSMRGIGPCYADKINRIGIRAGLLLDEPRLRRILNKNLTQKNKIFEGQYKAAPLTLDEVIEPILKTIPIIKPLLADTSRIAHKAVSEGKNILLEGNQGILLDLDHGTYPYVTSSSCLPASGMSTFGLSPVHLTRIIGISKSYQTRVGKGPFPTKLDDEVGQEIRDRGNEYGTTTGRPRDCGWLDLVALKYAVRVSGATELMLTLLDVFDTFDEIKVCTSYELNGERTEYFNPDSGILEIVKPQYISFKGWKTDLSGEVWIDNFPKEALEYIKFIEDFIGIPINMVSVGPEEKQTCRRKK
ncbi:MAG: adenylosuccinate synthase [Caldisericia bacterium]